MNPQTLSIIALVVVFSAFFCGSAWIWIGRRVVCLSGPLIKYALHGTPHIHKPIGEWVVVKRDTGKKTYEFANEWRVYRHDKVFRCTICGRSIEEKAGPEISEALRHWRTGYH